MTRWPARTARPRAKKPLQRVVYGRGRFFPESFSNTREAPRRTVRIDSRLLEQAESEDPAVKNRDAAEALRRIVATVGRPGEPGEQVRCVVSVAMLTEGWDANNVTHILGLRAFRSQLLCEQVVGRGLRRMDYTPDPTTGRLTAEYADVYGIPFSIIPFKGRETKQPAPEDKPKNHVHALPERKAYEIRFPVVEGYAFDLRRNAIKADVGAMEGLRVEPEHEPTAVFVKPRVGYQVGALSSLGPGEFVEQDRKQYYASHHLQTIEFEITRQVVNVLVGTGPDSAPDPRGNPKLRLQARHRLFPQVFRVVHEYVERKVDFRGVHPCELGLEKYVNRTVGRLLTAIEPDDSEGESPLLPILDRYEPVGSTADVNFLTVRRCVGTQKSHINQVVLDTETWEQSTAFRLEQSLRVAFYARNDELGLTIGYEYEGQPHVYMPDFLVRLADGRTVLLETKGYLTDQDRAKHAEAKRWVSAVNHWGQLGSWAFALCDDPQRLGDLVASL